MGVYVFSWQRFKEDIVHKYYKHLYDGVDFAQDVIPILLTLIVQCMLMSMRGIGAMLEQLKVIGKHIWIY